MPYDVFISYPKQNKPEADAVCAGLEARRVRCWIAPRDVQPGMDWAEAIMEGLANSRIMVVVFSAHANSSRQIMREVERAVNKGLIIIPLRLENTPFARSLEYFLSTCHWLDAIEPPLQAHIDRLATTIADLLSGLDNGSAGGTAISPPSSKERSGSRPRRKDGEINARIPIELVELEDPIMGFHALPDGPGLVVCYPQEARVLQSWPPSPQDRRIRFESAGAVSSAVSADGALLAVGERGPSVSVYRLNEGEKSRTLQRPVTEEEEQRFEKIRIDQDSFEYGKVAFSGDGLSLAAAWRIGSCERDAYYRTEGIDEPIDVFGLDGQFKYRIPGYGSSPRFYFSQDHRHVLVGLELQGVDAEQDNFAAYDVEGGKKVYGMRFNGFVRDLAIHPDGKQVIVALAGEAKRSIRFLSVASGRERMALSPKAIRDNGRYPCVERVCIDRTGQYLASAHNRGVLRLWDARHKTLLHTWLSNPHGLLVDQLCFCNSGKYLLASLITDDGAASELVAAVRMSDLLKQG